MARAHARRSVLTRFLSVLMALVFLFSMAGIGLAAEPEPGSTEAPSVEASTPTEVAPAEPPPSEATPEESVEAGPVTAEPAPVEEAPAAEAPAAEAPAEEAPADEPTPVESVTVAPEAASVTAENEVRLAQEEPELATYKVRKFHDYDLDGERDETEPWLGANFTFSLRMADDEAGVLATTDANGWADFGSVPAGDYRLTEVNAPEDHGWMPTIVEPIPVSLSTGENATGAFGNSYFVHKYFELDYEDPPEGAEFWVEYDWYAGGEYDEGSMSLELDDGVYVGEDPAWIPSHAFVNTYWWARWNGQTILLDSMEEERLDAGLNEVTNTLTYEASISGHKYNDMYGDGEDDSAGLGGWKISLYRVRDAIPQAASVDAAVNGYGELYAETYTNSEGFYEFIDPLPGRYVVVEEDKADWEHTSSSSQEVVIANDSDEEVDFYNHRDVTKTFELDFGKAPEGAEFWVHYDADCMSNCHYGSGGSSNANFTEDVYLTGSGPKYSGSVTFPYGTNLHYRLEWWAEYQGVHYLLGEPEIDEDLLGDVTNPFVWDPSASGYKFGDVDGDGVWDEGEVGLKGWTIYLYRKPSPAPSASLDATAPPTTAGYTLYATAVTDAKGYYEFDGLLPGVYAVAEEVRTDWKATLAPEGSFSIKENGTHITGLNFGNQEPSLPYTEEEEFLPFTGGELSVILMLAGIAGLAGLGLRRLGRGAA